MDLPAIMQFPTGLNFEFSMSRVPAATTGPDDGPAPAAPLGMGSIARFSMPVACRGGFQTRLSRRRTGLGGFETRPYRCRFPLGMGSIVHFRRTTGERHEDTSPWGGEARRLQGRLQGPSCPSRLRGEPARRVRFSLDMEFIRRFLGPIRGDPWKPRLRPPAGWPLPAGPPSATTTPSATEVTHA